MNRIVYTLILLFLAVTVASAQTPETGRPRVLSSTLITDVLAKKEQNPEITPSELARFANERLKIVGLDHHVDPCDVGSVKTELGFPGAEYGEVFHVYRFADTTGASKEFLAREPGDAPCGCWLNLPLVKASTKFLEIVTDKGPIQIKTTDKLLLERVELMDNTLMRTIREWIVINGGEPAGISSDGKKVYMSTEIDELFIETAEDGSIAMVPRDQPDIITNYTDLKKFPKDPNNDYVGFRKFTKGKTTYTLKFSHVCT
ncbi:MAG TPA: hypothetical protein PKD24_05255 [Pyrinomonadaceae bacterium]|nr:hypothetical protein [Pyrinomonadaceae bacterium]HMP64958.1 hypothetical protein [Pyrinomonadaceae bacterium]